MVNKKEDFAGLTRREFLYLSGVGMAGMTLAGIPRLGYGAEKKTKVWGKITGGVTLRYQRTGCPQVSRLC
jgi:hypothetical protein